MRQPGSWGQWSCSQITAHEGDQRSLIFERFSFCYFWSDQGRLILEEQYFLPKCHEKNDGLKLRCSLLDCKFGGYLLCVTFCLNKQLCLMDFDRIREGILKGKNYLHFTADWLMICLSMLNSGSVSFVSRTSHLAGNGNNNVNFSGREPLAELSLRNPCHLIKPVWQKWTLCHALLFLLSHHAIKGSSQECHFWRQHRCT